MPLAAVDIPARPTSMMLRPESTIRDAMFRDFHCLVVEDCTAEPIAADAPRTNHEASLTVLELLFACITDFDAVLAALLALPATARAS